MVLLLFFVDFESDGVVVIEEDAEEVVKVDLLEPLGNLVDVVGHDQVRHGDPGRMQFDRFFDLFAIKNLISIP